MSKGAKQLLKILRKLYPNQRFVTEYHIGERLLIDIYLPSFRLGFEYDGRQHSEYVEHFHGNKQGFLRAKKRDMRKEELCAENNVALVRVAHDEPMDEESVRSKIMEALNE